MNRHDFGGMYLSCREFAPGMRYLGRTGMVIDESPDVMTFKYGRYMKATIAVFLLEQTACFDRIYPNITNVIAQTKMIWIPSHACAIPRQSTRHNGIFAWPWESPKAPTETPTHTAY